MPHPYLDERGPIALAHRGGDLRGLENSLAAFDDAVALGYRYLETDLRATRDGVLVALHDPTLRRLTGDRGVVGALTWAELSRVRIRGREPVVPFDELVAAYPQVRFNLDVKADDAVAPLVDRLRSDRRLLERVCVASFSDARLGAVRSALGAAVCTSAGPGEVRRMRSASVSAPLARQIRVTADCLQVPVRHRGLPLVDARFLAAARERGLPVHVWVVNHESAMDRLLDLGVDGIVTDATRTLRTVLQRRGHWTGGRGAP